LPPGLVGAKSIAHPSMCATRLPAAFVSDPGSGSKIRRRRPFFHVGSWPEATVCCNAAVRPVSGPKRKSLERAQTVENDPARKWCVHRSSRAVSQRPRLKRGSGTTAINENATARPPIPSRLIGE
jgi:hypothetical protein